MQTNGTKSKKVKPRITRCPGCGSLKISKLLFSAVEKEVLWQCLELSCNKSWLSGRSGKIRKIGRWGKDAK